jgi:hypothetical protein
MDHVTYNTFTSEDSIIPCRVDGDVLLASPELLEPLLRNFLNIFVRVSLMKQHKLALVPWACLLGPGEVV